MLQGGSNSIKESVYCANRGICDFETGNCVCFDGFTGIACTIEMPALKVGGANLSTSIAITSLNFTSTALKLHSERTASDAFDFITSSAGESKDVVFNVRGDGRVAFRAMSIPFGGLMLEAGGMSILDDGMKVYSSSSLLPVVSLRSTSTSARNAPVLKLTSATTNTASNYLLRAQNQGDTRFTLRADGQVAVYGGGLSVSGGMTISTGGLRVTDGLTITSSGVMLMQGGFTVLSGGLRVSQNGAVSSGTLWVNNGGVTVVSGGIKTTNSMTVYSGGANVNAGGVTVLGGVATSQGATISSSGIVLTGGATVTNKGLSISNGVTIMDSGFCFPRSRFHSLTFSLTMQALW